MSAASMLATCALLLAVATAAKTQDIDWRKVDTTLGRAAVISGEVHRYGFPRSNCR
jgi:hypothetical protein